MGTAPGPFDRVRSDVGLIADIVTLGGAAVAAAAWVRQGDHWPIIVVCASGVSWLISIGIIIDLFFAVGRLARGEEHAFLVVFALIFIFIPVTIVMVAAVAAALFFNTLVPLEIGGLILAALPAAVAIGQLWVRYRYSDDE